jgi:MerR family transcriptional regulator, light-induced transcriptional regulator
MQLPGLCHHAATAHRVLNQGELAMSDSAYPNLPSQPQTGFRAPGNDDASRASAHMAGDYPQQDGADPRGHDIMSLLARVVRRDIVPNLITANRVIGAEVAQEAVAAWRDSGFNLERGERDLRFASGHIRMVDVARFVRLLRSAGADAAPALVEVLLSRGIPRGELYLDLLGPAAHLIGDMWLDDDCSFAEVTMVVARLHHILNALRGGTDAAVAAGNAPLILLSASPGEQHSFSIAVVEAVFQEAGWRTQMSHTNDAEVVIDLISRGSVDAIGFSLSNGDLADVLRATILRVRAMSANPDVLVLVGGQAFQAAPDLVQDVGADATIGSGAEAARNAMMLLPRQMTLTA